MNPRPGHIQHWSDHQQQRQEQQQQQLQLTTPTQLSFCPVDQTKADDMIDVLHAPESQWSSLWQSVHAAYFDRQHRVLWWRILHGNLMCRAYFQGLPVDQLHCPYFSCSACPQTLSDLFMHCPAAAQAIEWLCEVWGVVTGQSPPAAIAVLLAVDITVWQPESEALRHGRLRLATLHSICSAAQLAHVRAETSHPPVVPLPDLDSSSAAPPACRLALKSIKYFGRIG